MSFEAALAMRLDDRDTPSVLVVPSGSGRGALATRRLMLAVLEQAILDHQLALRARFAGRGRVRSTDTFRWFRSRDAGRLFAFESICDALGLDAATIRRRLAVS